MSLANLQRGWIGQLVTLTPADYSLEAASNEGLFSNYGPWLRMTVAVASFLLFLVVLDADRRRMVYLPVSKREGKD